MKEDKIATVAVFFILIGFIISIIALIYLIGASATFFETLEAPAQSDGNLFRYIFLQMGGVAWFFTIILLVCVTELAYMFLISDDPENNLICTKLLAILLGGVYVFLLALLSGVYVFLLALLSLLIYGIIQLLILCVGGLAHLVEQTPREALIGVIIVLAVCAYFLVNYYFGMVVRKSAREEQKKEKRKKNAKKRKKKK